MNDGPQLKLKLNKQKNKMWNDTGVCSQPYSFQNCRHACVHACTNTNTQSHTHTHTAFKSLQGGQFAFTLITEPIGTCVKASLLHTHSHLHTHRLVHIGQCISWSSLASGCTGGCWDHEPVKTVLNNTVSVNLLTFSNLSLHSGSQCFHCAAGTFFHHSIIPHSQRWCEHLTSEIINFI